MPEEKLNSLEDFQRCVTRTIEPWSKETRTALAAAMAERWLPVYEAFYERYVWGNPVTFQDAVQFVWNCVLGHKLTSKDLQLHHERVQKNTPDSNDFDCEAALGTSAMISYALKCCGGDDNTKHAIMAMVSGFEALAPGIYTEPEEVPPEVWWRPNIQIELEKQLKVLKLIGDIGPIDEKKIEALRQTLTSPDLQGPVAPPRKRRSGLTNEAIFERYRSAIEPQLVKEERWEGFLGDDSMFSFSKWLYRYMRRQQDIEKMNDDLARHALLVRNSAHDAAVQGDPGWDQWFRFYLTTSYMHPENDYDANSPEEPHRYGPSFRRLCVEGRFAGALQWARHRPLAWEEEDFRKGEGLAHPPPELEEPLSRELSWRATDDLDHPWTTEVDGETWRIRLNDFPDDVMYTLIINGAIIGNFHDWPKSWHRDKRRAVSR